jgi:hypothetical protein
MSRARLAATSALLKSAATISTRPAPAAEILHRHPGRSLAADAGDIGAKSGHVEDAAELG